MVAPVVNAGSYTVSTAADGKAYTRSSRWANTSPFNVSVSGGTSPQYRIKDPGGTWGLWTSTASSIVGNVVSTAISIPSVSGATASTVTESSAVTISDQGHQIQVRDTASETAGGVVSVEWTVGGQVATVANGRAWSLTTYEAPGGYDWDVTPYTTVNHIIETTVDKFDGITNNVQAGDVIMIRGGTRTVPLTLQRLRGTAENPILVVNEKDAARVVFNIPTSATCLKVKGCKHVIVDGCEKFTGASPTALEYGIKVTSNNVNIGIGIHWNDLVGGPVALIATVARSSNVVTITTTKRHGLYPGMKVSVSNASDTSFHITNATVLSVADDFTFTYAQAAADVAQKAATGNLASIWFTSDITMRGVWLDGNYDGASPYNATTSKGIRIGLRVSDDSVTRDLVPNVFRENLLVEYCKFENITGTADPSNQGTAIYIGTNLGWPINPKEDPNRLPNLPALKNVTFRHNIVQNCCGEGVDIKSVEAGFIRVYGNYIRDCAMGQTDPAYRTNDVGEGIQIYECTNCDIDIYDNIVLHTGQYGIQVSPQHQIDLGDVNVNIYNNIVYDVGWAITASTSAFGFGIDVSTSNPSGGTPVHYGTVRIYNNTIHETQYSGIQGSQSAADSFLIYNNIVSRANIAARSGKSAYPTWVGSSRGNITLTDGQDFVEPDTVGSPYTDVNLHLSLGATAIGAGVTSISGVGTVPVPAEDYDGVTRGSPPDSGALEYIA